MTLKIKNRSQKTGYYTAYIEREGAGTFREYLILGWGGVVGGVSDPQNCKIQKVPRVLFEDKIRYFFTFLTSF